MYASQSPSSTTTQHSLPGRPLPLYLRGSFTGWNAPASPDAPQSPLVEKRAASRRCFGIAPSFRNRRARNFGWTWRGFRSNIRHVCFESCAAGEKRSGERVTAAPKSTVRNCRKRAQTVRPGLGFFANPGVSRLVRRSGIMRYVRLQVSFRPSWPAEIPMIRWNMRQTASPSTCCACRRRR